jgi:ketosteroid isomerase-like protein
VTLDTQDWQFEKPWLAAHTDEERARVADAYQAELRADILGQQQLGDRLLGRRAPAVLLLHASAVGAAQWDALFCWLRHQGYRFASADEVMADDAMANPPEYVADAGPGLWDRLLAVRREDKARAAIRQLLDEGDAAWNRGDLRAFVSSYAEDAVFVSPSGITRGRQAVLDRYLAKYGEKPATMGTLSLDILDIRLARGNEFTRTGGAVDSRIHGASVVADWHLHWSDRAPPHDDASGHTLLSLRRRSDGSWEIVHDASM